MAWRKICQMISVVFIPSNLGFQESSTVFQVHNTLLCPQFVN